MQGGMLVRKHCEGGLFIKCDFVNNRGAGAVIENDAVLQRCTFHHNHQTGVLIRTGKLPHEGAKPHLFECAAHKNWGPGMEVRGKGSAPSVECCELYNGEHSGLLVTNYGAGTFQHCDVFQNCQSGVSIRDYGDPELIECSIRDGTNTGVTVFEHGRGKLIQCSTSKHKRSGFSISTHGDPSIVDCEIADGQTDGVIGIFVYDNGFGRVKNCRIHGEKDKVVIVTNSTSNVLEDLTFVSI